MKSQKWYDAIRAANSRPKTDEHKAKIAASKKGKAIRFADPIGRAAKISAAQKGVPKTDKAIANAAAGRAASPIWRAAILAANAKKRGRPIVFSDPEARRAKLRESLNRPETRLALSEGKRELWARRSMEEKQAIAEKSSRTQKGRQLSPEHLANLRIANSKPRSEEHRQKLGAVHKGKPSWNNGLTKFTNASVRSTSEKQIGRVPDYNKYRAHYDGPKGKLLMRSRWEVAYAEYLDRQGTEWQYEPRWFNVGGGAWTGISYTPDFYLPATDEYIEIKGRLTQENANKMQAFRVAYPGIKLTILSGAELTALGLIDKHRRLIDSL